MLMNIQDKQQSRPSFNNKVVGQPRSYRNENLEACMKREKKI